MLFAGERILTDANSGSLGTEDGQPFAVKLPGFGKVHGLEFERSGGISIAEPDTFGVPADQIPGVLNAVYTTGRIPQHLEFVEQIWD